MGFFGLQLAPSSLGPGLNPLQCGQETFQVGNVVPEFGFELRVEFCEKRFDAQQGAYLFKSLTELL